METILGCDWFIPEGLCSSTPVAQSLQVNLLPRRPTSCALSLPLFFLFPLPNHLCMQVIPVSCGRHVPIYNLDQTTSSNYHDPPDFHFRNRSNSLPPCSPSLYRR